MSRPEPAAYRSISSAGEGWPGGAAGGGDGGVRQIEVGAVHHEQPEVGQRIAEGGHLPVQDGVDRGRPGRAGRCPAGSRRGRRWARGRRAAHGPSAACSSSIPASSRLREASSCLPQRRSCRSRNPSGRPKSAEPHRFRVHRVQVDQRVDQGEDGGPGALGAERGELLGGAVRDALDVLHDVEGRPEHRVVLAEQHRLRHRDGGGVQGADHPVLALHVVRGGQHMAQRRSAYHPAAGPVGDGVRQVRAAALDEPRFEGSAHQPRPLAVEMAAQQLRVETWRGD